MRTLNLPEMLTGLFKMMSKVPLRVNYFLATGVAWLLHSVVRYRRKIVMRNLRESFPEKTEKELKKISREYYRFLGDYFVETVALASMSEEEMRRRLRFENVEAVDACLRSGRPVTLFLGHYCNWEWCSSIPLHISAPCRPLQIYHPLSNKDADRAFLMLRDHFGTNSVPMADTLRAIVAARQEGLPSITGYIADQAPLYDSTHLFLDFLNHDTPVLTGAEKISRRIGAAVFYCDMRRESRGHYVCRYVEISPDASKEEMFTPTRRYWRLLEKSIRRQPAYWLWSHRRWKRTREGFFSLYGPEEAARRLRGL